MELREVAAARKIRMIVSMVRFESHQDAGLFTRTRRRESERWYATQADAPRKGNMLCRHCGIDSQIVVETPNATGCWSCVATGPFDNRMMLRQVELNFEDGTREVRLVRTRTNLEAFELVNQPGVIRMHARPVLN
jgi:hypothetical protein